MAAKKEEAVIIGLILNLFGHQLVLHYKPKSKDSKASLQMKLMENMYQFLILVWLLLNWNVFHQIFPKQLKLKEINFIIEPYVRFKGKVGEQATMFFLDPVRKCIRI